MSFTSLPLTQIKRSLFRHSRGLACQTMAHNTVYRLLVEPGQQNLFYTILCYQSIGNCFYSGLARMRSGSYMVGWGKEMANYFLRK